MIYMGGLADSSLVAFGIHCWVGDPALAYFSVSIRTFRRGRDNHAYDLDFETCFLTAPEAAKTSSLSRPEAISPELADEFHHR